MENTEQILFSDETAHAPEWYLALGEKWIGPQTAIEIYEQIQEGKITWAHYVWKKGQKDWARIADTAPFKSALPQKPHAKPAATRTVAAKAQVKKSERSTDSKAWYLYYNEAQFGPFNTADVDRFLRVGKLHGRVHAWKEGFPSWERLEKIAAFDEAVRVASQLRVKKKQENGSEAKGATAQEFQRGDRRAAPREPLVARIFMTNGDAVIVGVCRDISVGGMQVLTDRIPGPVGTRIRLNVSPPDARSARSAKAGLKSGSKSDKSALSPFVAEGVVVRILEDGNGFSFRFSKLPAETKKSIEGYVQEL